MRVSSHHPPHLHLVKQRADEGTQRGVGGGQHGSHRRASARCGLCRHSSELGRLDCTGSVSSEGGRRRSGLAGGLGESGSRGGGGGRLVCGVRLGGTKGTADREVSERG
uniref:Uncharacterized protein n=1 Tax=Setaria italica TaxID=4555 RepID=K4AGY5_SETIT